MCVCEYSTGLFSSLHGEQEIKVRKLGTFLTFTCFWAILTRDSCSKMVFDETHAAKWFLTALGGAQHRNIRKNKKMGGWAQGPANLQKYWALWAKDMK